VLDVVNGWSSSDHHVVAKPADPSTRPAARPWSHGRDLRIAEFVNVSNGDDSLTVQLRNRPPDAEVVGTEAYGFMLANVASSADQILAKAIRKATDHSDASH
jgi:hypothetical protein